MNVPTYPDVKKVVKVDEMTRECIIELSTYVRIKRNKERYKILIFQSYNFNTTKDTKTGINDLMYFFELFNKYVIDTKYLFVVTDEVIKQLNSLNPEGIIEDNNTFKEADRIKAKAFYERGMINKIIN